jgi:Tfp pilus assembly protein PilX
VSRQIRQGSQGGFALVLALLALMLLTFLGLTLAMTTSTELQIGTNYRWSQQALYNAEAGLEVARAVLMQVGDGQLVLPTSRAGNWNPPTCCSVPIPRYTAGITRNFEGSNCDTWGNGAGYGQVLVDPNNPGTPFENVSTVFGQSVNGAFTVWVRRDLIMAPGVFQDNPVGENIIVTSEGSAPFRGALGAFQRANRAVRILESQVRISEGCKPGHKETSDTGFDSCNPLP